MKQMKNGGVIPHDELHVTGKDSATLKVTIPAAGATTPEYASVTVKTENVKQITVTPQDKSGKPTDTPKTVEVSKTTTTTEIKFDKSTKADHLTVEVVKATDAPVKSDITSVKACLEKNGEYHDDRILFIYDLPM